MTVNPELAQHPITSKKILQEWKGSQDITKRICDQQSYSKRMANRREMIKKKGKKKKKPWNRGRKKEHSKQKYW